MTCKCDELSCKVHNPMIASLIMSALLVKTMTAAQAIYFGILGPIHQR